MLHNIIKKYDCKLTKIRDNSQLDLDYSRSTSFINIPIQGGNATREAFSVREMFKEYFNSHIGSVSWQSNI